MESPRAERDAGACNEGLTTPWYNVPVFGPESNP